MGLSECNPTVSQGVSVLIITLILTKRFVRIKWVNTHRSTLQLQFLYKCKTVLWLSTRVGRARKKTWGKESNKTGVLYNIVLNLLTGKLWWMTEPEKPTEERQYRRIRLGQMQMKDTEKNLYTHIHNVCSLKRFIYSLRNINRWPKDLWVSRLLKILCVDYILKFSWSQTILCMACIVNVDS